jgi:cyclopropane fatty-acyl-phospholipid synthase-like methyltransferase
MTTKADVRNLASRMQSRATRTAAVVDEYYTLCIPFYREFLGKHWHTGYYRFDDQPVGPQDQLRMEQRIAESAGMNSACHVLDVGCGMGGPACHLARLTGARIRGLTPNAAQLALARSLAVEEGVGDRVAFDQGDAGALPYPDNAFDAVLFFESPCHFPDRQQFFREVHRVLKPGGRLAGEDWLAAEGLNATDADCFIRPICQAWALPELGTCTGYASDMAAAGLRVEEAVDLRAEMALLRGFLVNQSDREEVREEMERTSDPIRRIIMEGLLRLGEAAAAGAFTLGRFLAVKVAPGT